MRCGIFGHFVAKEEKRPSIFRDRCTGPHSPKWQLFPPGQNRGEIIVAQPVPIHSAVSPECLLGKPYGMQIVPGWGTLVF